GEAFNGALAVCLSEGRDLAEAAPIASAAGALSVTKPGAQDSMPERSLVDELIRSQRR
ncbi:MAG: ribokinase, partial [Chloroflexi bacterium]|nr:ribokinase [Chloroflexota bacterium]